jgi:hypothetical protein
MRATHLLRTQRLGRAAPVASAATVPEPRAAGRWLAETIGVGYGSEKRATFAFRVALMELRKGEK